MRVISYIVLTFLTHLTPLIKKFAQVEPKRQKNILTGAVVGQGLIIRGRQQLDN